MIRGDVPVFACDLNRSLQHLNSNCRERDVEVTGGLNAPNDEIDTFQSVVKGEVTRKVDRCVTGGRETLKTVGLGLLVGLVKSGRFPVKD